MENLVKTMKLATPAYKLCKSLHCHKGNKACYIGLHTIQYASQYICTHTHTMQVTTMDHCQDEVNIWPKFHQKFSRSYTAAMKWESQTFDLQTVALTMGWHAWKVGYACYALRWAINHNLIKILIKVFWSWRVDVIFKAQTFDLQLWPWGSVLGRWILHVVSMRCIFHLSFNNFSRLVGVTAQTRNTRLKPLTFNCDLGPACPDGGFCTLSQCDYYLTQSSIKSIKAFGNYSKQNWSWGNSKMA